MKTLLADLSTRLPILTKLNLDLLTGYFIDPYIRLTTDGDKVSCTVLVPALAFPSILSAYGLPERPSCVDDIVSIAPHIEVTLDTIDTGLLTVYARDYDVPLQRQYPFDPDNVTNYDWNTHQWRRMRFDIDTAANTVVDYYYYYNNVSDDVCIQEVYCFGSDFKFKESNAEYFTQYNAGNFIYFPFLIGVNLYGAVMHSETSTDYQIKSLTIQPAESVPQ